MPQRFSTALLAHWNTRTTTISSRSQWILGQFRSPILTEISPITKAKLAAGEYSSPNECATDVRLVWTNAFL
ncbi:unnamed protein product, partial [Choristocarpus tenellus]